MIKKYYISHKLAGVLLILLLFTSQCRGQDKSEKGMKLNSSIVYKPYLTVQHQLFKVTLADSWFGKDKAHHFLVSAFLTAGSYYFFRQEQNISEKKSLYFSSGFAFSLGIAKEIRDGLKKGNAASIKDIFADIIGIGIGSLLFNIDN